MIGAGDLAPWLPLSWLSVAILVGSLAAGWSGSRFLPRLGIDGAYVWTIYPFALTAGVLGAKAWAVFEAALQPGHPPVSQLFHLRTGATFYGGLIFGAAGVIAKVRWDRQSLWAVTQALAPGLALAQAIGRIGCFLVGCDYGLPTALPWGMAFPRAPEPALAPVHPAQLYESAWLFACAWLLGRRVERSPLLIAEYLVLQGAGRFAIELVRTNAPVAGPLTLSQLVALACVACGALGLARVRDSQIEGR